MDQRARMDPLPPDSDGELKRTIWLTEKTSRKEVIHSMSGCPYGPNSPEVPLGCHTGSYAEGLDSAQIHPSLAVMTKGFAHFLVPEENVG